MPQELQLQHHPIKLSQEWLEDFIEKCNRFLKPNFYDTHREWRELNLSDPKYGVPS